ncbi:HDOD domain-containing protein [Pseudoxanthomonas sp. LH2527]|uniref:HDOD domain-containing protein n=1 Tax=Pseudoxanthomonas sp. LH2527 TaxID=2923249 RepID=UPI001F12E9B5|nr:HDOD domain-containing protein [Pseudoxanthomonas sp. LH2527]MCH6484913.1 HDOD domain-containing protein [Pseudoxanthomonas sp. LH2527]
MAPHADITGVVAAEHAAPSRDWAGPLLRLAHLDTDACLSPEDSRAVLATARGALARFADDPQRLPRRPQLLPQLLGALNDDDTSGRDIAGIIARDPALAANLLKLANSALYRRDTLAVESLDRAVAMVGVDGLRHLVAVALMQPVMRVEGGVFGRLPELVWEHTQRTALVAARLAGPSGREAVFAAQLLALLQGLGAIVVVQVLRDAAAGSAGRVPDAAAMARVLHRWSPRLGCAVAREWGLSERLMQALREQTADDVATLGPLARVLASAAPEAGDAMENPPVANAA